MPGCSATWPQDRAISISMTSTHVRSSHSHLARGSRSKQRLGTRLGTWHRNITLKLSSSHLVMNPARSDYIATESTELATGEPPIRSRVAPDINPIGGGIVDDAQAGELGRCDASTRCHPPRPPKLIHTLICTHPLWLTRAHGHHERAELALAADKSEHIAAPALGRRGSRLCRRPHLLPSSRHFPITTSSHGPSIPSPSHPLTPAGTSPGDGKTHTNQLSGEEIAQARQYAAEHRKRSSSESKNPSFMDKVSGFGNVVAGKVFDNPAKVAYGKAKAQGEV